ncbi:MAG: autoinducer-2 kinase [Spirochaetes bacterium]|nr:autoinducer-2 kinase [Spirochaetota bacterium]
MSKSRYLLVVDVGTGSGRSLVFDENGTQLSVVQKEWTHPEDPSYPGAVDFLCEQNWKLLSECIRRSISDASIAPDEIAAVSTTSMRQGIVCYDGGGREIFAVPNIDARANEETAELIEQGWGPKIYAIEGDWPSIHAIGRIWWMKKHRPKVYEKLSMMTMLSDWVVYKLCGRFVTEPSVASSSGMFDLKARKWSSTLAGVAGLLPQQLPPVLEPSERAGSVSKTASAQTGIPEHTPVITGAGDTQGGYIGSGVIEPGDAGLVAGSFWVPAIIADEPLLDDRRIIRTNCHAIKGRWIVESCSFYTGLVLRWFRDAFYGGNPAGDEPPTFELMNEEAAQVPPGSHGMQVIFSDVGNNSRWIHAAPAFIDFDILDPARFNRATFARAILENTAYQSYGEFENIARVYGSWPDEVRFSGGGSNSPLLCQMLSDTLDRPVRVPLVHEATALGTAAVAAYGAGLYGSLSEACGRFVRWEHSYEPDRERGEIYREAYRKWRTLYPHMMALVEKGLTKPMWRAPATLKSVRPDEKKEN